MSPVDASVCARSQIESYDDVPWYRKAWFIFFPLFIPAALVIILTGDI